MTVPSSGPEVVSWVSTSGVGPGLGSRIGSSRVLYIGLGPTFEGSPELKLSLNWSSKMGLRPT